MPTFTYFVYTADALDFSGGTVRLDPNYDTEEDRRVVTLQDNDANLDGDFTNDETGADGNQRGTVYESDGTTLANVDGSFVFNDRIYAESQLTLTGDDGSEIQVYVLESGGDFVGYLPSAPLLRDVDYSYTSHNVINDDELTGYYRYLYPQYVGEDATDPGEYSEIEGAVVVCFTPNSQVTTPKGPQRIRTLAVGDYVLTRDRGYQPIRWIHRRTLSRPMIADQPHLAPIVFERNALGPGCPQRRMKVSPQHRMLIESHMSALLFADSAILAPAKGLVNGRSVYQDQSGAPVTYVHLLFDQHEVIEVDGLFSESYHPGEWVLSAAEDAVRQELFQIFPELATDLRAYGPTCYPAVSVREARLLRA
ncbi:Hint domain-containing protein [Epibacterium sp. MM17-32]|uniref:Hint domain-containing protein n=1 Tax=Epibacterium sp. MM17-32 TaxID=2917734 RepID=UPI001EF56E50|nr:Hint domain-containing protein [Epibacterium sp. MM17-32]MCG7626333.1 Hint domain-containing protein [Epibacterium sp. MM17-32]